MNQRERVLRYLENHEVMTPNDAIYNLGITKLATVVSDLRLKDGYTIYKKNMTGKNRFGEKTHFTAYSLKPFESEVV